MLHEIRVVNKHHKATGEYIGRGSPLGNPYPLGQFTNRTECVKAYKEYITLEIQAKNEFIINEFKRLRSLAEQGPLNLVCFCAPRECHGDVIKQILEGN